MIEFLDWLARAGGVAATLTLALGFMFREKWKQVLARSLATDLERLKAELAKSHAEHAASLTPQLEAIKHDFQQKLEAYKVSLIAETEAVKARSELKKSIAMRFAETEFERLVALEGELGPIYAAVVTRAGFATDAKQAGHAVELNERFSRLDTATDKAEMFMSHDDRLEILQFRAELLRLTIDFVGPGKPVFDAQSQRGKTLLNAAASSHRKLKERLIALGKV